MRLLEINEVDNSKGERRFFNIDYADEKEVRFQGFFLFGKLHKTVARKT